MGKVAVPAFSREYFGADNDQSYVHISRARRSALAVRVVITAAIIEARPF